MRIWQKNWLLVGWIGLVASSSFANYQTYVIHTYGNPNLPNVIAGELTDGGTAQMYQDQLILRATTNEYAKVSRLLERIDTAPTSLNLSLKIGQYSSQDASYNQVNLGGVISSNSRVWVNGRWQNTSQSTDNTSIYRVQGLSGAPMKITSNTLVNLMSVNHAYYGGWGRQGLLVRFVNNQWVTLSDGFYATATILPNGQVSIALSQYNTQTGTSYAPSSLPNQQNLITQLVVARNQWVQIGDIQTSGSTSHQQNGAYTAQTQSSLPIWIRVD